MFEMLSNEAIQFWNLKYNPFSVLPLQFSDYKDFDLLVKTRAIQRMIDIYSLLKSTSLSRTLLIVGDRGSGKTTAMNYLGSLIIQDVYEGKTLPVYCSVLLEDESIEKIRLSVHESILAAIIESYSSHSSRIYLQNEEEKLEQILAARKIYSVEMEIHRVLKRISSQFERIFLIIDNIDKAPPDKYPEFLKYFTMNQGFYERIASNANVIVCIAMQSYMYNNFRLDNQVSYLGDQVLRIPKWSFEELDSLLEKRMKQAAEIRHFHSLNHIFSKEAREIIYRVNYFLPRFVMRASQQIMQEVFELDQSSRKPEYGLKPIPAKFCLDFKENVRAALTSFEMNRRDEVGSTIMKNFPGAYSMIRKCLRDYQEHTLELMEGIVSVWVSGDYEKTSIIEILKSSNIIRYDKKSKKHKLTPLIKKLMNYLGDYLDFDYDSIKYFFISSSM